MSGRSKLHERTVEGGKFYPERDVGGIYRLVRAVLLKKGEVPPELDDLSQDSMARLLLKSKTFEEGPADVSYWITRIVMNVRADYYRTSQHRQSTWVLPDPDIGKDGNVLDTVLSSLAVLADPLIGAYGKEIEEHVARIHRGMPKKIRCVGDLLLAGHNTRRCGEILGLDSNTAKAYALRWRTRMREKLENLGIGRHGYYTR